MSHDPTPGDPIARFLDSLERARASERFDPDRAALATADARGRPSVRFMLVRGHGPGGFDFFTNYESRKATELDDNPWAELAWHWDSIGEQVRVRGRVSRLSAEESDAYFALRPRGSQIGAWASPQSQPIDSREGLERRVHDVAQRFEGRDVERPAFWGGYRLVPAEMEFWVNRDSRLHDRDLYRREGSRWVIARLAP